MWYSYETNTEVVLAEVLLVCSVCPRHCGNHQRNKMHSGEGIMGEDRESGERRGVQRGLYTFLKAAPTHFT